MTYKQHKKSEGFTPTPTLASLRSFFNKAVSKMAFQNKNENCVQFSGAVKRMPMLVSGFTLIETMVAITILLIAVVGPMSAIGGSLSQISIAHDQMIAINLAQEGIEVVRQKRDSNMLACWAGSNWGVTITSCNTWVGGITGSGTSGTNYIISSPTISLIPNTAQPVYQDASGFFVQASTQPVGSTKTRFSRVVNITDTVSGREKKITSTVTWKTSGGVDKTITVSESIFGINF